MDNEANLNLKDREGNTPLHYACSHHFTDIAILLIDYGGNIYIQNNLGQISLDLCDDITVRSTLEVVHFKFVYFFVVIFCMYRSML